ncbi:MAG: acetyl-CoA carboxylase biotin carboxyl carrier protein [candidate division NC10 bacterium]|nr:acetyl-CoA carboxylase biotin carboxyl carrier protein [candidate division NC10 bacterium]MBI2115467.1 acetyl-CoA carboxylase biotin carboxyl carrier protein [candidate division NC10 bacterium]MBI2163488.1 acetyl-CoA carboxylase biotin carboxyl carrier protein [candidate division NC10 bacterium]MBI2458088.1 acetyl-CoA carboxylase biotin carboxyl carrier protein [candidate division NC10 bacterium]MBI3084466.1 acetyl-CoA carboxylase biotin carboxyl carrier protein [candidate division NC10 bact
MDLKELKALLRLMEGNDVEELEVEEGGRRVRIRRRAAQALIPQAAMLPVPQATVQAAGAPAQDTAGLIPVESPMVGTFYRAPAPGAEPYVKEGDIVQKGTTVCIIEAMKLMNEIEAEVKGRVARILVENGQPVEFGQTLFLLEPA